VHPSHSLAADRSSHGAAPSPHTRRNEGLALALAASQRALPARGVCTPQDSAITNASGQVVPNRLFAGAAFPEKLEAYQHRSAAPGSGATLAQVRPCPAGSCNAIHRKQRAGGGTRAPAAARGLRRACRTARPVARASARAWQHGMTCALCTVAEGDWLRWRTGGEEGRQLTVARRCRRPVRRTSAASGRCSTTPSAGLQRCAARTPRPPTPAQPQSRPCRPCPPVRRCSPPARLAPRALPAQPAPALFA
jgi:hypothetical protein